MSFNRANLSYSVERKGGQGDKLAIKDMVEWINTKHQGHTGIVYCSSRQKCEDYAKLLREEYGLPAAHYHAEVDSQEKINIQRRWQNDDIKIIVATVRTSVSCGLMRN